LQTYQSFILEKQPQIA